MPNTGNADTARLIVFFFSGPLLGGEISGGDDYMLIAFDATPSAVAVSK